MSKSICDCLYWDPNHDPAPTCSLDASPRTPCTEKATHMFVHRKAGRHCEHLICDAHAKDPLGLKDHDAVPLATMFPKHFGAERPS